MAIRKFKTVGGVGGIRLRDYRSLLSCVCYGSGAGRRVRGEEEEKVRGGERKKPRHCKANLESGQPLPKEIKSTTLHMISGKKKGLWWGVENSQI